MESNDESGVGARQKTHSIGLTLDEHRDWEDVHQAVTELIDHVPANYPMRVEVSVEVDADE